MSAIIRFTFGVILIGLLLFLPTGTINYPNAWLFMNILFIPMFIVAIVMTIKNPELLRKCLNAKERQKEQSLVIKFNGLIFVVEFVLAGLDFRFRSMLLPQLVSYIVAGVFLLVSLLYAEVLWEITCLSMTIEVQENQEIIDTRLYAIVRHPMYSVTIILFLVIPLVLGSFFSFVISLFYPLLIVTRIKNEEQVLKTKLDGMQVIKRKLDTNWYHLLGRLEPAAGPMNLCTIAVHWFSLCLKLNSISHLLKEYSRNSQKSIGKHLFFKVQ